MSTSYKPIDFCKICDEPITRYGRVWVHVQIDRSHPARPYPWWRRWLAIGDRDG